MKKIYFSMLLVAAFLNFKAQLTLTKANNEPVIGDVYPKQQYDSTSAVPKSTGTGMVWNFSTMTANTNSETSTYMSVASTPNGTTFPGATIAEQIGTNGNYTYYKSTSISYEVQGFSDPSFVMNFSNTVVFANWPITMGYNNTDSGGGTGNSGTVTAMVTATANVMGSGTGTVVLPGGNTLSNILQVITTITVSQAAGTFTQSQIQKQYDYYHSSQKFPVLSMQYQTSTSGTMTSTNFQTYINKNVALGIVSHNLNSEFVVYPNPAKDMLIVSVDNAGNENTALVITNLYGQEVKSVSLGNNVSVNQTINVADLSKGVYFLNLKSGKSSSVKKIIIE